MFRGNTGVLEVYPAAMGLLCVDGQVGVTETCKYQLRAGSHWLLVVDGLSSPTALLCTLKRDAV